MPVSLQQMNTIDTVAIFKKEGVTAKKIAAEIALVAFSDMADYVQVDEAGSVKPIPFDSLKKGATRAIRKIREKRRILDGKDKDDTILEDTFDLELIDKMDGLRLASECLGLKKPIAVQGDINAQVVLDEDLKLYVKQIMAAAPPAPPMYPKAVPTTARAKKPTAKKPPAKGKGKK